MKVDSGAQDSTTPHLGPSSPAHSATNHPIGCAAPHSATCLNGDGASLRPAARHDGAHDSIDPAAPATHDGAQGAFGHDGSDDANPLPGEQGAWEKSGLGSYHKWSAEVRGYATTAAALTYPAAVFYGSEFVILHNKAWAKAGGSRTQGQCQINTLSAATVAILTSVIERGIPQEIQDHDLLQDESTNAKQFSTAIVSPLLAPSKGNSQTVLVQLLPKPLLYRAPLTGHCEAGTAAESSGPVVPHDAAQILDSAPIDEHPFFRRFAAMLPSGLAILDRDAKAVFVNQQFYNLTTMLRDDSSFTSWPQSIHSDDYDRVMKAYQEAFQSRRQLRTEFRARGENGDAWRLLLLNPLGDENLQHVSLRDYGGFICSIVDISSEKSAEIAERKAAQQARERKEQQERFIDMISHEIRNPLSAVLHCAEDIGEEVRSKRKEDIDTDIIIEAVETIGLCVSHQKNIVHDVLSFSKLDASLLSLVPKRTMPSQQLANTLKMFQPELRKQSMSFGFDVHETYKDLQVNWCMADMPRIGQVLVNLVTNAIKFTNNTDGERNIICSVAASRSRPKSYPPSVVFFESEGVAHRMDSTNTNEWGNGEEVYIMVAVTDTGIGISSDDQKRLFERFRQATPKTEEVYGGSGLGLNISRKICHLHGGEIGVSSKEGKGSTFGFFFKARRADADTNEHGDRASPCESHLRDQLKSAGISTPQKSTSTEPFEWTSGKPAPESRESAEAKYKETAQAFDEEKESHGTGRDALVPEDDHSKVAQTAKRKEVGSPKGDSDSPAPPVGRSGSRLHVLLVEDNVINQRILCRKLKGKGFDVTIANNGQEAVEAVRAAPKASSGDTGAFDVILMDQEMPKMDGNSATKAIREYEQQGEAERIPILGVTANVRGAQQDEMIRSGMDEVMSKPYRIEDMVDTIQKVCSGFLASEGQ